MRTPVVLVCGQGDTDAVAEVLGHEPRTVIVRHRFDGQVVVRSVGNSQWPLEMANGCVACTVRDDLLVLLRRLHRRGDIDRIVVVLMPWLEPEPVCWAIDNVRVHVGAGFEDGPAVRDVRVDAVVSTIDTPRWLRQALGDDELDDGRTTAQVVVGQAEFADVLVLTEPEPTTLSVLRRLAPRSRITVGTDWLEMALSHLEPDARRGRSSHPHDPLLAGQPSLDPAGDVGLLLFSARRPFHPHRLHAALDLVLDGVVRTRGRLWLANRFDDVMWVESAGGGLLTSYGGKWLAAMDSNQLAYADPQRRAVAAADWDPVVGDRHVTITVLVCGAQPEDIVDGLRRALLTGDEMSRPDDWAGYDDPFGDWHEDPCEQVPEPADVAPTQDGEQR
ncbi:putative GTPase, G3E family [Mycobacterium sp. JS623]|uniref:ribosome hibernation factor-recruiting GTPase MRF n=1 Tax=Mycobacterium sp. JS623 TaxID=212767 RepID=UPI0002A569F0|nr:GTP-binding protein [Mycobacterium sp. JS623]AGB22402.1 putative GTPase, G3E family [Mycobacterium sp. JS623]